MLISWAYAAELTAVFALAGVWLRSIRARWARITCAFTIEAGVITALYTMWQLADSLSARGAIQALARGRWIAQFEHHLDFPAESSIQGLIIGHPVIVQIANLYYASMHFGSLIVFLIWLFVRHRDRYGPVRTTLALSTLVCLVISFLPVAPPRVVGDGIVDTAARYGQSVYQGGLTADQLAAMPSVHVLWATAIGWYAVRIARSRWRLLVPLHSAFTVFVVIATANHWWLDGIVAVLVLIVCAWARAGIAHLWPRPPGAQSESATGLSGELPAPSEMHVPRADD